MTLTEDNSILIKNLYLLKEYGAKRLIKEHFSPLWKITEFMPICLRGAVFFET